MTRAIVYGALVSALSGCGGGSGSPHAPQAAAAAGAAPAQMTQASISITVPAPSTASSVRRAAYISAAAQSVAISSYAVVNSVIAGTATATSDQNLTSVSPGCSGAGTIACTVTVPVPIGRVAFSVTVYQGLGETGAVLSSLPQSPATE